MSGAVGARACGLARRLHREQGGQLLVLLIGLVLLVLMVLALGWDTSNWLIGRRVLNDVVDGAAVAAAGELDEERYLGSGGRATRLAPAAVRATVADHVAASGIDGLTATSEVDVDAGGRARVAVRARAPVATVFLQYLGLRAACRAFRK
jgi:uncharacterized membrane protein